MQFLLIFNNKLGSQKSMKGLRDGIINNIGTSLDVELVTPTTIISFHVLSRFAATAVNAFYGKKSRVKV